MGIYFGKRQELTNNFIKKHRFRILFLFILLVLIIIPFWTQGIMCNDELISRYWSMQGFTEFYRYFWTDHIEKGRAFSTPFVSFTMYMGFLGKSNIVFRILPILSILLVSSLFGYLISKIFVNKYFGLFCMLVSIVFLPVTFEHTSPNAYSTLYNIPFALLLISFIVYNKYLTNNNIRYLLLSMGLFLLVCITYELFITYVLFYICLYLMKKGTKNVLKESIYPVITGLLFLVLYMISRIIFPSSYDGNQIGGFTLDSMLSILKHMFISSFPGYFLGNSKYAYLQKRYESNLQLMDYVRVFILVGMLCIACYRILQKKINEEKDSKICSPTWIVLAGILYCIIPALPTAISRKYQGIVNENSYIALPTTFFTYFSAVFVCCYIIWILIKKYREKHITILVILFIGINLYSVQIMNSTISNEQNDNFKRLCRIENFMETDFIISKLSTCTLYSEDIFKAKNTLAINNDYWNSYVKLKGSDVVIKQGLVKDEIFHKGVYNLYYVEENYFAIENGDSIIIASPYKEKDVQSLNYYLKLKEDGTKVSSTYDNGFYIDYYQLVDDKYFSLAAEDFEISKNIGGDINTAEILSGYSEDGWLSKFNEFNINSGNEGILTIGLNCLKEMDGKEKVDVYIDDLLVTSQKLSAKENKIVMECKPNQIIKVRLEFNYEYKAAEPDIRMITAVLTNIDAT